MRQLSIIFVLGAWAVTGQSLTFSPQGGNKVALWVVNGCPTKPVPTAMLWAVAIRHSVTPIATKTAAGILEQKSVWSRVVKAAGWVSAGGAVLTGFDVVKTKPQVVAGFAIGGGLILALLPLAAKEIPQVDPSVGGPLLLGPDGCGTTTLYTLPSSVAAFIDEVKL